MRLTIVHIFVVACALGSAQNILLAWRMVRKSLTTRDQLFTVAVWQMVCATAYALLGLFLLHAGVFVYLVDLVTR